MEEIPKQKSEEIIHRLKGCTEKALIVIDEILQFYRKAYRKSGSNYYLKGLEYYNKVKYETQIAQDP